MMHASCHVGNTSPSRSFRQGRIGIQDPLLLPARLVCVRSRGFRRRRDRVLCKRVRRSQKPPDCMAQRLVHVQEDAILLTSAIKS